MTILNYRVRFFVQAAVLVTAVFGWEFFTLNGAAAQGVPAQRTRTTASPAPSPAPSATPAAAGKPGQTLADLQGKIRAILSRPQLRRGLIGIKAVSLDTDKVLFEENAEKYFMPASNMKSFTVAAALVNLSPNFRFVTSVYALAAPDVGGTVKGDLTIYGRGDPSISTAFNNGNYYRGMEALADKIVQAGVKKIDGAIVGDESYFTGDPIGTSWEWDDLQWHYGAEISALSVNDNAVDLTVRPGAAAGSSCLAGYQPLLAGITLINKCVTTAGGARTLTVVRKLGQNVIELTGGMPRGDSAFTGYIATVRPAQFYVSLLRQILMQKGVTVTGQTRVIDARDKAALAVASSVAPVELARLESPPLSLIAANTMKPSQNLYTELILRALGEQAGNTGNQNWNSFQRGRGVVAKLMTQAGIASDGVVMYDGSGLSRHNLVTPAALVSLYTFMSKSTAAQVWRDALPIGGVDGTLKGRLRAAPVSGNVRAKTGTIDQVSGLTGYLTTAGGERLVFSIIFNGVTSQNMRENTIDEIAVALAGFNGRSQ